MYTPKLAYFKSENFGWKFRYFTVCLCQGFPLKFEYVYLQPGIFAVKSQKQAQFFPQNENLS